jgi:hypothetical protein
LGVMLTRQWVPHKFVDFYNLVTTRLISTNVKETEKALYKTDMFVFFG